MKKIKRLCKCLSFTLLFLVASVNGLYAENLKNNPVSTSAHQWGRAYLTGTTFSIADDASQTSKTYFKLSEIIFGRPLATLTMGAKYTEANGAWNDGGTSDAPRFTIMSNPALLNSSYQAKTDDVNRLIFKSPKVGETVFTVKVKSYKPNTPFAVQYKIEKIAGAEATQYRLFVNGGEYTGSLVALTDEKTPYVNISSGINSNDITLELKRIGGDGNNEVCAVSDFYIYGEIDNFSISASTTECSLGTPVTLTAVSQTEDISLPRVRWQKRFGSPDFHDMYEATGAPKLGETVTDIPEAGETCYRAVALVDGSEVYSNEVCVFAEYKCSANSASHILFIEDFGDLTSETDRDNGGYGGEVEYINTDIYKYVGDCKPLKAEGTYALMTNPKYAGYGDLDENGNSCSPGSNSLWFRDLYDHTRGGLSDGEWGAMLMVNAANLNGVSEQLVYSREVEMPCTNTNMIFSAWFANAANPDRVSTDISMKFVVRDQNGIIIDAATLPVNEIKPDDGWVKGETSFNSGNNTTLTVEIYNCIEGGNGNDFMVDDISFSICVPEVSMYATSTSNKVQVDAEKSIAQGPCGDPVTLNLATAMVETIFDDPQYLWYVKGATEDDFVLKNYNDNRAQMDTVITAGTEIYAVVTSGFMDREAYIYGQLSACAPVAISNTFTLLCMPELSIVPMNPSCNTIPLQANVVDGPVDFKWQISNDGTTWRDIDRAISQDTIKYTITEDSYFRIVTVSSSLNISSDPTEKYIHKELALTATPNRGFYGDEIKLNATHKNIENDNGIFFDWYKVTAGDGQDVYTNLGSTNVAERDYTLEDREAKIVVAAGGCEAEAIVKQIEIGVEPMDRVCNDIILQPIAILGYEDPLSYKWQRSFDGQTWEDVPASEVKAVENENMPGLVSISITKNTMFRIAEVDASGRETGIYSNQDQIQEYEYKKLELIADPTSVEEGEDSKLTLVYENFDPTTAAVWYEIAEEGEMEFNPSAFPQHEIVSLTKTTTYKVVWDQCEAEATVRVILPATVAFMGRDCNKISMQATVDVTYGSFWWEVSNDGSTWTKLEGYDNQDNIQVDITETTYFRVNNALDMPSDASYSSEVHSITLEVDQPEINRDEQVTLTATTNFSSNLPIKWYQNNKEIDNTDNPYSPTLQTDATFYVESEGCKSESVFINVIQPASVEFVSRVCNEITLSATVESGVSYKWQKSTDDGLTWTDMTETGSPITVSITEDTKFRVKTNEVESETTELITLWGISLTIDKESIILGEEVTINASTENASDEIIWFENNEEIDNVGNSYTAKPLTGATYKVVQGGCPSNEVELNSVIWPTIFTPMHVDGFNDDFIVGMEPKVALKIYDRYGNLVVETTDGWDGKDKNGKYAMPNVYYYVATLPNGEIIKGNVELLSEKQK